MEWSQRIGYNLQHSGPVPYRDGTSGKVYNWRPKKWPRIFENNGWNKAVKRAVDGYHIVDLDYLSRGLMELNMIMDI